MRNFEDLKDKVITKIDVGHDEIIFEVVNQGTFKMYHSQDCCENVTIDDINGDIQDLLFSPILLASERTSNDSFDRDKEGESFTWTFYTLATIKGYVDIRWIGTSNGYYSEHVDFRKID